MCCCHLDKYKRITVYFATAINLSHKYKTFQFQNKKKSLMNEKIELKEKYPVVIHKKPIKLLQ